MNFAFCSAIISVKSHRISQRTAVCKPIIASLCLRKMVNFAFCAAMLWVIGEVKMAKKAFLTGRRNCKSVENTGS